MILTDNETKVDLLNNEAIAATIVKLSRDRPDQPVTVGVHGDWGAGKSSIRSSPRGRTRLYFSVNAEMIRSGRGKALVANLPMDRLLTETDGPFTRIDGRPTEPTDARAAIEAIAGVRSVSPDAIARTIRTNLQTLLR